MRRSRVHFFRSPYICMQQFRSERVSVDFKQQQERENECIEFQLWMLLSNK